MDKNKSDYANRNKQQTKQKLLCAEFTHKSNMKIKNQGPNKVQ